MCVCGGGGGAGGGIAQVRRSVGGCGFFVSFTLPDQFTQCNPVKDCSIRPYYLFVPTILLLLPYTSVHDRTPLHHNCFVQTIVGT